MESLSFLVAFHDLALTLTARYYLRQLQAEALCFAPLHAMIAS
jgi:hypothetical protein